MSSVFRTATKQAIKEIIEEHSQPVRYGLMVDNDGMERITDQVIDLFEMTLNLRAKTQDLFTQLLSQPPPQPVVDMERQEYSIAKRQSILVRDNDEEKFYAEPRSGELLISKDTKDNSVIYRSFTTSKLPRHKTELSYEERERILAQR